MSIGSPPQTRTLDDLRREFDDAFAVAPQSQADALGDFLSIRVAGDVYALRLTEVGALAAGRPVTRLPDTTSECLGIASVHGAVVPVFDLRVILGHPAAGFPRWLVVTANQPAALAFDVFDGHLRLPASAVARADERVRPHLHVHEAVRSHDRMIPVVSIASILHTLTTRIPHRALHKEP